MAKERSRRVIRAGDGPGKHEVHRVSVETYRPSLKARMASITPPKIDGFGWKTRERARRAMLVPGLQGDLRMQRRILAVGGFFLFGDLAMPRDSRAARWAPRLFFSSADPHGVKPHLHVAIDSDRGELGSQSYMTVQGVCWRGTPHCPRAEEVARTLAPPSQNKRVASKLGRALCGGLSCIASQTHPKTQRVRPHGVPEPLFG